MLERKMNAFKTDFKLFFFIQKLYLTDMWKNVTLPKCLICFNLNEINNDE